MSFVIVGLVVLVLIVVIAAAGLWWMKTSKAPVKDTSSDSDSSKTPVVTPVATVTTTTPPKNQTGTEGYSVLPNYKLGTEMTSITGSLFTASASASAYRNNQTLPECAQRTKEVQTSIGFMYDNANNRCLPLATPGYTPASNITENTTLVRNGPGADDFLILSDQAALDPRNFVDVTNGTTKTLTDLNKLFKDKGLGEITKDRLRNDVTSTNGCRTMCASANKENTIPCHVAQYIQYTDTQGTKKHTCVMVNATASDTISTYIKNA